MAALAAIRVQRIKITVLDQFLKKTFGNPLAEFSELVEFLETFVDNHSFLCFSTIVEHNCLEEDEKVLGC